MKKMCRCENCNYYGKFSGVCYNCYSDFVADFVDKNFSCNKWEEIPCKDEKYLEQIKALKVGDTVTIEHFDDSTSTAIVTKLTEKGEIITDNGRFRFHSANGHYKQYGTYSVIKF